VLVRAVAAACRLVGVEGDGEPQVEPSEQLDLSEAFTAQVVSAFSEVFNNVVLHSYGRERAGEVEVAIHPMRDGIEIRTEDHGEPFDLAAVPTPDLDAMPEGGMGVFIIRQCVDDFVYEPGPPNRWTLRKRLGDGETDPPLAGRSATDRGSSPPGGL
jgi:serine/threonine-protein kinase RsbW